MRLAARAPAGAEVCRYVCRYCAYSAPWFFDFMLLAYRAIRLAGPRMTKRAELAEPAGREPCRVQTIVS
eukprot:11212319-Lingulodinium_polyedra.AAC.1